MSLLCSSHSTNRQWFGDNAKKSPYYITAPAGSFQRPQRKFECVQLYTKGRRQKGVEWGWAPGSLCVEMQRWNVRDVYFNVKTGFSHHKTAAAHIDFRLFALVFHSPLLLLVVQWSEQPKRKTKVLIVFLLSQSHLCYECFFCLNGCAVQENAEVLLRHDRCSVVSLTFSFLTLLTD